MTEGQVRPPAVAGRFYPAEGGRLRRMVKEFVAAGRETPAKPKVLIAPHAGFRYSGPIAGTAYRHVANLNRQVTRVILLGPAHFVPVTGIALSPAAAFATPLGAMPVDRDAYASLAELESASFSEAAHKPEHSLELQLPFLQVSCPDASIVPLLVGDHGEAAAFALERLWGGEETLIVISSDLSHYHDGAMAHRLDRETASKIESLQPVKAYQACGYAAINGLVAAAARHQLKMTAVDLRHSGETAGMSDRVVGYGAFVGQEFF